MGHIASFLKTQDLKKKQSKRHPKIEVGEWVLTEVYGFLQVDSITQKTIGLSEGHSFAKNAFWCLVDGGVFEIWGHCKQVDGEKNKRRRVDVWSRKLAG